MFTDEQLAILYGMPNLDAQEEELARQHQMAGQLRGLGQNNRMDWGSQVARGVGGLGAGYMDYKAGESAKGVGEDRRKLLQRLFGGGGTAAPVVNRDITGGY